jgi:hypothetical protein
MLFNKNSTGSSEVKDLIGFIYRSINFDNLKSYIDFAERDIRKIVGKDVLITAQNHYASDNYLLPEADADHPEYAVLDELVRKIQYPVAVLAYRRYAPSNDVTHSDKGRQIFVSEQEKPAFEWQIEKDNENLLSLAHEAIDMLIEFLDDHLDDVLIDEDDEEVSLIPWKEAAERSALKSLFIPDVMDFEKVILIGGSRYTFLALMPIMARLQENEIKSVITAERYDDIQAEILAGTISAGNAALIDKIRQPLALLTLSVAVKRLTVEVLPTGVFSNIVTNVIKGKQNAGKTERNEISDQLERDGLRELRKLQDHIAALDAAISGETIAAADLTEHIDPDNLFVRL